MHLASHAADAFAAAELPPSFKMSDYRPERRRHGRRKLNVAAEAARLDNTLAARRDPRLPLFVLDVSEGGIAATSSAPVVAGERLAVHLPASANLPTTIYGRVVRCDARRTGWFLAIRFDSINAA